MLFEFSLIKGTITIFYLTMPIQDFFSYIGALWMLYKNYSISAQIAEKQAEQLHLDHEKHDAFMKESRRKYIRDNARSYYLTVKKLAESTENTIDDKLVLYVEKFAEGMKSVFGSPPTTEERDIMSAKAEEIHIDTKAAEKLSSSAEKPTPQNKDVNK